MDRAPWAEWVSYPSWPCPTCQRGHLRLKHGSDYSSTSRAERRSREEERYNHNEQLDRLTGHLICDHKQCGETATFAGDIHTLRLFRDGPEDYIDTSYRARSILPAPLPFPIGPKVPKAVAALIREAAALYWLDQAAAVSRVREAIGAILTDLAAPEHSPTGKRLALHKRIAAFRTLADGRWDEQADIIEAAKWIGNEGTHETVSRDAALDAFEMLETVIDDLYVRSRHALLEKVRATNDRFRSPKP
jgi:hypothetical protein